jgi:hypothetical protein
MPDDILEYWMSLARELAKRFNVEEFDKTSAMWSWENFGDSIGTLRNRLGVGDSHIEVLGIKVDLKTGDAHDMIKDEKAKINKLVPHLYYYTRAQDKGVANEWVKFNSLSGSWACRYAFDEEDVQALAKAFSENKGKVDAAMKKLGGIPSDYGDFSYEVSFLPMVKVLLVFEEGDEEFPPGVRLLYDKNSIYYLPHEMLGNISWLLVSRIYGAL